MRLAHFWRPWRLSFERAITRAQANGCVPANLDVTATAETLPADSKGVILLAQGRKEMVTAFRLRGSGTGGA